MQLYLIRHPVPAVDTAVCYGASDVSLAPHVDVAAEAARLASRLPAGLPVYSSPLSRCRSLALALDAMATCDDRLREMNFGAWELRAWNSLPWADLDAWAARPLDWRPPGGETVRELMRRVFAFTHELQGAGSDGAVLVTHAGVMKVLTGHAHAMTMDMWMRLKFDFLEIRLLDKIPPVPPS